MVSLSLWNAQSSSWSDLITEPRITKEMTQWKKKSLSGHLLAYGSEQQEKADTLSAHQNVCAVGATYPWDRSSAKHTCSETCSLQTVFFRSRPTAGYAESGPAFRAAGTATRNCCSKLAWKKKMAIHMAICSFFGSPGVFVWFCLVFNGVQKIRLLKPFMYTHGEHWAALVFIKQLSMLQDASAQENDSKNSSLPIFGTYFTLSSLGSAPNLSLQETLFCF